jgi:acyl-coenzyme A thioesterase PaaI-like protein
MAERTQAEDGMAERTPAGPAVVRRRAGDVDFEIAAHHCFACGELNERGLRLRLHLSDRRCWTELTLGPEFEGWEGVAHGGILATVLDEVMAWALVAEDAWGLTARLTTEFKRPVRVRVPIRAEGWLTEARRRLLRTEARIMDAASGEVLATATGLYVAAGPAEKADLKKRYRFRLVPRDGGPPLAPPDRDGGAAEQDAVLGAGALATGPRGR